MDITKTPTNDHLDAKKAVALLKLHILEQKMLKGPKSIKARVDITNNIITLRKAINNAGSEDECEKLDRDAFNLLCYLQSK